MGWRSNQRRRAREDRVAGDGQSAQDPTDDAVARAELHRDLVDAVLALDEPYRQTVLLRFVNELSAAEIARRQDVPAGTVRSRLKRGLDQLRFELDRRHGDRATWQRALIPLAVPTTAAHSAAVAAGALVMKITLASVAAAGVAALAIVAWPRDQPPRAEPPSPHTTAGAVTHHRPRTTPAAASSSPSRVRRFRSVSDRQRFAAALAAVRARRERYRRQPAAAPAESPPTGPEPSLPRSIGAASLDREYIQDRIRDVAPLIKECYQMALDAQPEADLDGRLLVRFTIDAEEEVGGFVSEAALAEPETPLSRAIGECVTETIYSIEFVPPQGGGQVTVNYPFVFRKAPE